MTGGTNGTVTGASHQKFLDKIDKVSSIQYYSYYKFLLYLRIPSIRNFIRKII